MLLELSTGRTLILREHIKGKKRISKGVWEGGQSVPLLGHDENVPYIIGVAKNPLKEFIQRNSLIEFALEECVYYYIGFFWRE